jgi:hypothetical protein
VQKVRLDYHLCQIKLADAYQVEATGPGTTSFAPLEHYIFDAHCSDGCLNLSGAILTPPMLRQ